MKKPAIIPGLVAGLVVRPIVTIWAINALFGTGIEFSLATWFAALWLSFIAVSKGGGGK